MRRIPVVLAVLVLVSLLAAASGCTPIGYYAGEALDGVRFLRARRPIERVLTDPRTSEALRRQLEVAVSARRFAAEELGLPANRSYQHYAELDRPYASWVVTAAPELSLVPLEWCFPIAGCVTYRGYFSPRRAERFADKLRRRGADVDVAGVVAFSTLGWFADPVLSTFVHRPPASLAGLIFHELAHQRLYLAGETRFNESFATFVEVESVERWVAAAAHEVDGEGYAEGKARQRDFVELLSSFREELAVVYSSDLEDEVKRRRKAEIFERLESEVGVLYSSWGSEAVSPVEEEWNNADLVAVQAYWSLVPAFRRLLAENDDDLDRFYLAAEELGGLEPAAREARLADLLLSAERENALEDS